MGRPEPGGHRSIYSPKKSDASSLCPPGYPGLQCSGHVLKPKPSFGFKSISFPPLLSVLLGIGS